MIIYPSIDRLLERVNSKYALCTIAAKRAHTLHEVNRIQNKPLDQLQQDNYDTDMAEDGMEVYAEGPLLEEYQSAKFLGRALEEIASGDIMIDPDLIKN